MEREERGGKREKRKMERKGEERAEKGGEKEKGGREEEGEGSLDDVLKTAVTEVSSALNLIVA